MVLTSKATQLFSLDAGWSVERLPASRSACFTQVEIDCAVGSNSRASSSGVRPVAPDRRDRDFDVVAELAWV